MAAEAHEPFGRHDMGNKICMFRGFRLGPQCCDTHRLSFRPLRDIGIWALGVDSNSVSITAAAPYVGA